MIEQLEQLGDNIIAFRASGRVSAADYENVLIPAVDKALKQSKKIRFYYQLGPDLEGMSSGAMWDDAKLGMQHYRGFERIVVVTGESWIASAVRLMAVTMPCPVKVFGLDEIEAAQAWLTASDTPRGLSAELDEAKGILHIKAEGPLTVADFESVAALADPHIEAHKRLNGLIIEAHRFPGWENVSAMMSHIRFVRDHQKHVRRIALVADTALAHHVPGIVKHFVAAKVQHFSESEVERAQAWLAEDDDGAT